MMPHVIEWHCSMLNFFLRFGTPHNKAKILVFGVPNAKDLAFGTPDANDLMHILDINN